MSQRIEAAGSDRLDRTTIFALVAMGTAVFVVANDFTALSVALPPIEKEFDTDVSTVQWVINAYALTFGVLIVVGGRLADMFGRRRMFVVGAAIFAAFSVIGGASQSPAWLIICRTLMGVGGALMWPSVLSMTYAAVPQSKAGLAGGLILGAVGVGNALGPLFGGILTDALSWRWIFFVNLPIAAFGVLVTLWAIRPDEPDLTDRDIDYAGVITLSVGLVALLVALDQVTDWGWGDPRIIGLIAGFVVLLGSFVTIERRKGSRALVPLNVFRNHSFSAACVTVALMSAVFFAGLLYLPQFMQKILGYSPLRSGAGLLPLMGMFALTSVAAGPLYGKLGPKLIVSLGVAAITIGALLLSLIGQNADYGSLVIGMLTLGVGIGLFYSSITTAAVTALDAARAGLAAGIVYMFQITGGSVGLGLNTTLFTSFSQRYVNVHGTAVAPAVTDKQLDLVIGIIAGTRSATAVVNDFTPPVADQLETLVRDGFVAGLHAALRVDVALAFVGLLIAATFVESGGPTHTGLHALRWWRHRSIERAFGRKIARRGG